MQLIDHVKWSSSLEKKSKNNLKEIKGILMINEKTIAIIVFTLVNIRDPYVVNLMVIMNINASIIERR